MDTLTYRYPLGVCAGITPFNFPAMIPLWVCAAYSRLRFIARHVSRRRDERFEAFSPSRCRKVVF